MSWLDEAVPTLRILINDLTDEPTYTDDRLVEILLVASKMVIQELDFDADYVATFANGVVPDPEDEEDYAFINFATLKAACIADQGQYRSRALLEGIRVSCGPTSLGVSGNLAGFYKLVEIGPCKMYAELATQYAFGDRLPARAVLSPFVGNNFDPSILSQYRNSSRFMR
jgi:hypothetical protein